jgi:hypothetical protein
MVNKEDWARVIDYVKKYWSCYRFDI